MSYLTVLPCPDSNEMAAARWRELDMPRHVASELGRSALEDEYGGAFQVVVFVIADWSPERRFLAPFRDAFAVA